MYLSDSDLYLSCLSGTYRNGAHSASLRFVVSFLFLFERKRGRDPLIYSDSAKAKFATTRDDLADRASPVEEDHRFTILRG